MFDHLFSASHDQTVAIWEWDFANNNVSCKWICKGHERSVECLNAEANGAHIASGSWDGQLKIWSLGDDKLTISDSTESTLKGSTKVNRS